MEYACDGENMMQGRNNSLLIRMQKKIPAPFLKMLLSLLLPCK